MPPSILDELNRAVEGRYRVLGQVGAGGMATVFEAEDLRHGRTVAIKVLRPELAESIGGDRFLREIEVTAGLTHPNILPLLDSGQTGRLLYYVMPFMEGESLAERLEREPQLPLDDAVAVVRQVAAGLQHAHARGIVHRDIKPGNVLLQDGQAVLADFGISKAVTSAGGPKLTNTGLSIGTPLYMSPEQFDADGSLDQRADVYSLGCVFYRMIVGEPPFTGPTGAAIMARHAVDPVSPPSTVRPDLPRAVDRAVQKALAKSPADRFTSATAFADAVEKASGLDPFEERRKAKRTRVVAGAVLAVVVALAGWFGLRAGDRGPLRVAVLPVELQGAEEQAYLASGVHSALITEMGQVGMVVVGRRSVNRYQDGVMGAREIAEDLNVDVLVEAELFPLDDDELRIVARLVDGESEGSLWSGSFRTPIDGIVGVARSVAGAVARETRVRLSADDQARLSATSDADPEAYQAWLRGQAMLGTLTPAGLDSAQVLFERALSIDPDYAPAHLGLAEVWGYRRQMGIVPPFEASPRARVASREALRYDSMSAAIQAFRAIEAAWGEWNWDEAENAFRTALALDPGDARTRAFYGHFLAILSRPRASAAQADSARAADPHDLLVQALQAANYTLLDRFDEALALADSIAAVVPGHPLASLTQRVVHQARGEDSLAFVATRAELAARGDVEQVEALDRGWARGGYHEAMREAALAMEARAETRFVAPAQIYELYLGAEMYDEAIRWVERGFDARESQLPYLPASPLFDPIRDDPRVQRIIRLMNFPGA